MSLFSGPVFIASDHAGLTLKAQLIHSFSELKWQDLGPNTESSVDYPDYADRLCQEIAKNPHSRGVLVCGSGQGMAMRANKFSFIRAALVNNNELAKLCRLHNDANVICFGGRMTDLENAKVFLETFLITDFEGQRHEQRVKKLNSPVT